MTIHTRFQRGAALALLVAAAGPVGAQNSPDTTLARSQLRSREMVNSSPEPLVRTSAPSALLSASNDGSTVEIQGGVDFGFVSVIGSVSSPLGEGSETWVADLAGLRGGSTLGLSLSGLRWGSRREPGERELIAWCRQLQARGRIDAAVRCTDFDLNALGRRDASVKREFERRTFMRYLPILYALSVKAGPQTFDFTDPRSLEGRSVDRVNVSASAAVGTMLPLGMVAVRAEYASAYEDAAPATRCTPIGTTDLSHCATQPFGLPERGTRTIVQGELKRFISRRLGVDPRVSYRFSDRVVAAELPVYFVPDEDGGLIAGVIAGWSSAERRVGIGAFVGKTLGLRL